MKHLLLVLLPVLALFSSCEKKPNCASTLELTADNATPTVGTSFTITATQESNEDVYQWNGPHTNDITQSHTLTITESKLTHRGWYYCNKGKSFLHTFLHWNIAHIANMYR